MTSVLRFSNCLLHSIERIISLARSAVELVKIVRETLEALFDLHLGLPDEVVTAAGSGLDSYLQR